jgi:hypothetical protein
MKKIRIVIVEDLEEVAEGLSEFISLEKELQLVASYRTAEAASVGNTLVKTRYRDHGHQPSGHERH